MSTREKASHLPRISQQNNENPKKPVNKGRAKHQSVNNQSDEDYPQFVATDDEKAFNQCGFFKRD